MRRKENEITDVAAIEAIIEGSRVCKLAMINGNTPYIVPLCFGYRDQTLYFHSALKGLKVDCLQNNPNVCFEFDQIAELQEAEDACDWGMKYQSVVGFGQAEFIAEVDEKRRALDVIMAQYSGKSFNFSENQVEATAVFKVAIESMTGKQSGQ